MDKSFLKEYLIKPACYAAVIVAVLFLLNKFTYFNFSIGSSNNFNSFEVIGVGKVTATPNVTQTTFTITEKGKTQEEAKNAGNTKQNQALFELNKLGIKEKDIKTVGFYVNPNYEDTIIPETQSAIYPQRTTQNGYVANISTTVKAENIEILNKAIDSLSAIGINVGGVEYTFDDREKYVLEAQNKAIENAKEQAATWAKTAGFKLGKIATIRNAEDSYGYQPYSEASSSLKMDSSNTQTDLRPGENEITAKMGVSFYIKN